MAGKQKGKQKNPEPAGGDDSEDFYATSHSSRRKGETKKPASAVPKVAKQREQPRKPAGNDSDETAQTSRLKLKRTLSPSAELQVSASRMIASACPGA